MKEPIQLKFSEKYDAEHSKQYFLKHMDGLSRRASHLREEQLGRRALKLAGDPKLVLDIPSGAGRFWPLLAECPDREIIGADNSEPMIEIACRSQPKSVVDRVTTLRTSAFDISLPDASVDCVFSMRLLHHIGQPEHRVAMLREMYRVTRDSLIISLWVDGNFKAIRRERMERRRRLRRGHDSSDYQNRFVIPSAVAENEFSQAGFTRLQRLDFLPYFSMWRVYVLFKS